MWFVPDTVAWSGGGANPMKILQFLLSFKLGKLKLLYKYECLFFLKTGNLIINWVPYKHPFSL